MLMHLLPLIKSFLINATHWSRNLSSNFEQSSIFCLLFKLSCFSIPNMSFGVPGKRASIDFSVRYWQRLRHELSLPSIFPSHSDSETNIFGPNLHRPKKNSKAWNVKKTLKRLSWTASLKLALGYIRTRSFENIFSVDLRYTEFGAFLLADKCHVTIFSLWKGLNSSEA